MPLYRKEFLWFTRDRSAIVQTILIPLTVASVQLFNLRGVLAHAASAWNYLCGTGILFGTYFLWILGPKSPVVGGPGAVDRADVAAGVGEPAEGEGVAVVDDFDRHCGDGAAMRLSCFRGHLEDRAGRVGWFFFSRSMAEKSVTLVTVTAESGEAEKIPTWTAHGRRNWGC